jgi:hypothetical protein
MTKLQKGINILIAIFLIASIVQVSEAKIATVSKLKITAINFDTSGKDTASNVNGELVKIHNSGTKSQQMIFWVLTDRGNKHVYTFPSFILNPGKTVIVYTGKGKNGATSLFMQQGWHIWNNGGDTATLIDNKGKIISQTSGP